VVLAVQRLRLQALAIKAHNVFAAADIDHLLLKGPTTADWLYDPPRSFCDVDVLIPRTQLDKAVRVLEEHGVARAGLQDFGEGSLHAHTLVASDGSQLDVHVSLPMVPIDRRDPDRTWRVVSPHATRFDVPGSEGLPALDEAGRCLTLALHHASRRLSQSSEDLRRAVAKADPMSWQIAKTLARDLGVTEVVEVALADINGREIPATVTLTGRLAVRSLSLGSQGPRSRILALRTAPGREVPRLLLREAFPSRRFLARTGWQTDTPMKVLRSHAARWLLILRRLISRRERRASRPTGAP
jgi:hypothetical protein